MRMAWLMKNCFLLGGETRLAGELGSEVHLRSSIRLESTKTKNKTLSDMSDREILPPCGTYQYYIKHYLQERLWQVVHRNNDLTTDKALL